MALLVRRPRYGFGMILEFLQQHWAMNAQIEFILRDALRKAGRQPQRDSGKDDQ